MRNDFYKSVQIAEAQEAARRAETMEFLRTHYQTACDEQNEEDAAMFARAIRNKLLEESDANFALDRLNLPTPSGSTVTAFLSLLKGIVSALTGPWAEYRKALRNLPEQPGFPFNIDFPDKPED